MATSETTPATPVDRNTALRESYAAAEKRLREAHPDEFNKFRAEEAKSRGVEWTPPKSAKDKARDSLKAIFAENPDLLAEVRGATVEDPPDAH